MHEVAIKSFTYGGWGRLVWDRIPKLYDNATAHTEK